MSVRAVPGPVRATSVKPPPSDRGYRPEEMRSRKGAGGTAQPVTGITQALADRLTATHYSLNSAPPSIRNKQAIVLVHRAPNGSVIGMVSAADAGGSRSVRVLMHPNKIPPAEDKRTHAPPSRDLEALKEKALGLDPANAIKEVYVPEFKNCLHHGYWITAKKILELVLSFGLPRDTYKPFAHTVDRMPRVPAYVGLSASLSHVPRPSPASAPNRTFVEL